MEPSKRSLLRAGSRLVVAAVGVPALAMFGMRASAQDQGSPITITVAFAAGASTDGLARILAEGLAKRLGRPVIVANKPGAFGTVAAKSVQRAPADGLNLLLASSTTFAIAPNLYKSADFDPLKDFTTIASLATGQNVLAINPDVPANTIQEFISLARANPGKFSYGSNSGTSLVASEMFKTLARVDIVGVPYKDVGTQMNDVIGGRISMVILDQLNATPLVRAGKLRGLAVAGAQRSSLLPNLPTLDESGLNGFRINSWIGLAGPAGMPKAVVERLNTATNQVVSSPEYASKLVAFGYDPIIHTPDQATALVAEELKRWSSMIAATGIKKE